MTHLIYEAKTASTASLHEFVLQELGKIATLTKTPIKWVQIDERLQARNRKARRAAQALKRRSPK